MAPQQLPSEARKASKPAGPLRLWYLSILSTVPFSQLPEVVDVPYSGQSEKLILPKLVSPRLAPRVWNPAAWFSHLQPSTAWDQLRRSQQPNASTFPVACGGLRLAHSPHIVAHWQRTTSDCWMRTHVSRRYNSFRWKSTFQWTTAATASRTCWFFQDSRSIWHINIDTYFTIVHDHCSFAVSLSLWWLYLLLYILNSLLAPLKPCSISTWPVCNDLWSWPVPCFNQRGKSFSALAITSNATWAAIQSPVSTDKKRIVWICRNGPVKNPDWCQATYLDITYVSNLNSFQTLPDHFCPCRRVMLQSYTKSCSSPGATLGLDIFLWYVSI